MNKEDQSTTKNEDDLQHDEESKCDISLPVESMKKSDKSNLKETRVS